MGQRDLNCVFKLHSSVPHTQPRHDIMPQVILDCKHKVQVTK